MKPMEKLEKEGPRLSSFSGAHGGASSRSHAPCGRDFGSRCCACGHGDSSPCPTQAKATTNHRGHTSSKSHAPGGRVLGARCCVCGQVETSPNMFKQPHLQGPCRAGHKPCAAASVAPGAAVTASTMHRAMDALEGLLPPRRPAAAPEVMPSAGSLAACEAA